MHYDVIIIGESLASRLTGALLAKNGLKVLSFEESVSPLPSWFFSCSTLERLLEQLDAQSCLAPPFHFQVLTEKTRLDLNGANLLEDELKREFSKDASTALHLLDHLKGLGQRIEEILWGSGLPVSGLLNRIKFAIVRFRNDLRGKTLSAPLIDLISTVGNSDAQSALKTLFAGLALAPADRLTIAEGALLWNSATRNRSVCSESLDELLKRRYQQFHGATEPLDHVKTIQTNGKGPTGITLTNGSTCTASAYLLGGLDACRHLPKQIRKMISPAPPIEEIKTSSLGYKISPLLSERAIASGLDPFRMTLRGESKDRHAFIETTGARNSLESIGKTLSRPFPFVDLELQLLDHIASRSKFSDSQEDVRPLFPGFNSLKISANFYLCNALSPAPGCAVPGEAIIARSLLCHILSNTKPKGRT